jgi:site-specific recombinase
MPRPATESTEVATHRETIEKCHRNDARRIGIVVSECRSQVEQHHLFAQVSKSGVDTPEHIGAMKNQLTRLAELFQVAKEAQSRHLTTKNAAISCHRGYPETCIGNLIARCCNLGRSATSHEADGGNAFVGQEGQDLTIL